MQSESGIVGQSRGWCVHARAKLQRRPVKFGGRHTRMPGSVHVQINSEPEPENAAADCRLQTADWSTVVSPATYVTYCSTSTSTSTSSSSSASVLLLVLYRICLLDNRDGLVIKVIVACAGCSECDPVRCNMHAA